MCSTAVPHSAAAARSRAPVLGVNPDRIATSPQAPLTA